MFAEVMRCNGDEEDRGKRGNASNVLHEDSRLFVALAEAARFDVGFRPASVG